MDWIDIYHDLTGKIVQLSGGSDKLVHVHAGLFLYLGMQIVLRDRRSSLTALRTVIVLELLNEVMDRLFWGSWRWADTTGDIVTTLLWPSALHFVGRYRRARWAAKREWELAVKPRTLSPQRA